MTETTNTRVPGRSPLHRVRVDTVIHHPDSVAARDLRRRLARASEGYGAGNSFVLPDERELVEESFLTSHCAEAAVASVDGGFGLRFRPVDRRRDGYNIRGTIWIDSATHIVRRLELEYLKGEQKLMDLRIDYSDVVVDGHALRVPSRGTFSLSPPRAPRGTIVNGSLAHEYWGFSETRAPTGEAIDAAVARPSDNRDTRTVNALSSRAVSYDRWAPLGQLY